MSSVNLLTREIAIKIVYYGPGLGGKTTSLQFIHRALKADSRGQLVSLATGVDRTLYFDFLPVKLPKLRGFTVRVQLYTVPGQVHYNSTRKLVLTGADAVVFVADSQRERFSANVESMENLVQNLAEQGLQLRTVPWVIQYNKRDAPDPASVGELEAKLNPTKVPSFETVATSGVGVFEALKQVTTLVLADLRKRGSLMPGSPDLPGGEERPRRSTAPMGVPISSDEPMTLSSLGEVADAIDKLSPADPRTTSGIHKLPTSTPARALSDLLSQGSTRDALLMIEGDIGRGDWAAAVRRAAQAYRELASRLAGSLASTNPAAEAPPLAALLTGISAPRYLRFREAMDRVDSGGAVASSDAMFALFFLTDCAMRAEDLRKGS